MIFKILSNPNHSVILCCDSMNCDFGFERRCVSVGADSYKVTLLKGFWSLCLKISVAESACVKSMHLNWLRKEKKGAHIRVRASSVNNFQKLCSVVVNVELGSARC